MGDQTAITAGPAAGDAEGGAPPAADSTAEGRHSAEGRRLSAEERRLIEMGRSAAMLVHDLKAPLTSMSTLGYVLTHQTLTEAQRVQYGEILAGEITRMLGMVEEILDYSKEGSARIQRLPLGGLLEECVRDLKWMVKDRPVEFRVAVGDGAGAGVEADLDPALMRRAVVNLAKNAWEALVQARAEAPLVTLEAAVEGEWAALRVGDNGPGVPAAARARLFEAFATEGKRGGTGLGLAIVRKVMEDHRGRAALLPSERGALFELRWPRVRG